MNVVRTIVITASMILLARGASFSQPRAAPRPAAVNDIALDAVLAPSFATTYNAGEVVPMRARFRNAGSAAQHDVPVQATIFDAAMAPLYTEVGKISGALAPSGTGEPEWGGYRPSMGGKFYVRYCARLTGDEVAANDCALDSFMVKEDVDAMPVRPADGVTVPLEESHYLASDQVRVEVTFRNEGTTMASGVPVEVSIYRGDLLGAMVYHQTAVIGIGGGGTVKRVFQNFIPNGAGRYAVIATTAFPRDANRANDTAIWSFTIDPPAPAVRVPYADGYQNLPSSDALQRMNDSLPVRAYFANSGGSVMNDAVTVVEIVDPSNTIVYHHMRILGPMTPNVAVWQDFPAFIPRRPGLHCATAWISHPDDADKTDDTARWCFIAEASSGVARPAWREPSSSIAIYPNPARDVATLEFSIPPGVAASVRLYDAAGRMVGTLAQLHERGRGHIALGFGGLAAGTYTVAIESAAGVIASGPITIQH